MKYFITTDENEKIVSWCGCTHERPGEIEISKEDYESLVSSEDWHYTYIGNQIEKIEKSPTVIAAEKAIRDAKEALSATDGNLSRVSEDIIDSMTTTQRDKLASQTLDKYNDKKLKRAAYLELLNE